ncbi:MAG: hypothetical protein IPL19_18555 [Sandaracinaceae bacterium]|nr:hypothetical protein [Sandaracinaceae bacterium]
MAVCGDCPAGYLGDGLTGCEVDACATDNGGCDALRLCTSADAVPTVVLDHGLGDVPLTASRFLR